MWYEYGFTQMLGKEIFLLKPFILNTTANIHNKKQKKINVNVS